MDALTVVLTMVGVAALLLAGAVLADRMLQRRSTRRSQAQESVEKGKSRDAADAVIELLGRTRELLQRTAEEAGKDEQQPENGANT